MKTHTDAIALLKRLASEWHQDGERLIFVFKP
jgi:hypothetical protein